jgi:predicted nucleic-acid-binding protein
MGRSVKALVDTSLLVRYLTGDPPHLAEKAAQVLDGEETLGITEAALVETAYALESVYGVPRKEVVDALLALLQKENLKAVGGDKDLWMRALLLCRRRRVSFGDASDLGGGPGLGGEAGLHSGRPLSRGGNRSGPTGGPRPRLKSP